MSKAEMKQYTHCGIAYTVRFIDGQYRAAFRSGRELIAVTHPKRKTAVDCIKAHIEDSLE